MVIIEPTDQIAEHYAGIGLKYQRRLPAQAQPGDPISEQLKRTRADRGLTYEQAAEEIGLAVGTLSNIENGSNPRPKTADKIRKWIAGQAPTSQQPSPEAVEILAKLMYRRHQRESKNNP
jgi:transcriptional regulator with XRE-family HTH domain